MKLPDDIKFNKIITLDFEDGSKAVFRYAAILIPKDPYLKLIVITEHCGYHFFNQEGTKITESPMGPK